MASSHSDLLNQAALSAQSEADFIELERIARELISLGQTSGDRRAMAYGYTFLGNAKLHTAQADPAQAAYKTALKLFSELGDRRGVARILMNLGALAVDLHFDYEEGRRYLHEALPIFQSTNDDFRHAIAIGNLGEIARIEGNYDKAIEYARQALEMFTAQNDSDRKTWQLIDLAHYHFLSGKRIEALDYLEQADAELRRNKNVNWTAIYVEVWFIIAAWLNEWGVAAQLLAFADRFRAENRVPRLQDFYPWLRPPMQELDRRLPADVREEQRSAGAELSLAGVRAATAKLAYKLRVRS